MCRKREGVIDIRKWYKDAGMEEQGINQTAARADDDPLREIQSSWLCFSTPPLPFSFLLSLPSLSVHRPVCLVFDFLCFMQKPPCPEGIDLQDCFDPVVMILLFASATSFSPLQSPRKMLWIRPEDGVGGRGEEVGSWGRGVSDSQVQSWGEDLVLRTTKSPGMERWGE